MDRNLVANEGERERKQPKEEEARMKEIAAKETKNDKVVTRLIGTKYSCCSFTTDINY